MSRPIDADALKELFSEVIGRIAIKPEMNGNLEHMIRASAMVIQMIDDAPSIQLGTNLAEVGTDLVSRQAVKDIFTELYGISAIGSVFDKDKWADICETTANELPPVQPKGTRLSTACLMCKKPAVTFNTEDDIPYTNYSYCEDCLRKGLKLLREQNKNLQVQPERKTGRWILDRSGSYCCDKCMEPCA